MLHAGTGSHHFSSASFEAEVRDARGFSRGRFTIKANTFFCISETNDAVKKLFKLLFFVFVYKKGKFCTNDKMQKKEKT